MLRLVAYTHDGIHRFPVAAEAVIGSLPECEICLPYRGVAQRHARVVWDGRVLRIEDLGARRGLLVNGERVRAATLEVLDEVRLGGVTLLVEDADPAAAPAERQRSGRVPAIGPARLVAHVAALSDWVLGDEASRATAESVVGRLLEDFGGGVLLLLHSEGEVLGVKLAVASDPRWYGAGEELLAQIEARRQPSASARPRRAPGRQAAGRRAGGTLESPLAGGVFEGHLAGAPAWIAFRSFRGLDRGHLLVAAFPNFRPTEWSPEPGLWAVGDLLVLGLVHHVGRYEPLLPGHGGQQDLRLAPGLIVGESPAMKNLLEGLRSAIATSVPVLLRGEPGSGQELLARTLQLSGPRRQGPFVVASASGASSLQVEADLFGAEVPGRDGPIRRQGKLSLADGGTLLLESVEELSPAVQARLLRFLETGEVEPAGSLAVEGVDVRLITTCRGALEPLVQRELFRSDLAYRLGAAAFDVPPLRERREDLPLLLQAYVNRFCHEAGKRVQGITVAALAALTAHNYPGNLPELESIVRQLVYLCPPGQPIRHELLPERLRASRVEPAARVNSTADLLLESLVATTERAAIREALRRTQGNKLRAAQLLGISRNGLAMKMERYGMRQGLGSGD